MAFMNIVVKYAPEFVRLYNKLGFALQEEIREKITLFKDPTNHRQLKVHKLHGRLRDRYSFSVNYKYRIIFEYDPKDNRIVILKTVGDHEIYK